MRGVPELLACAAAGLACQNIVLSLFLVFCAACVLDTKTKLFVQGGFLTCIASIISELLPKARYMSMPLGICAFLLPALTPKVHSSKPAVYTPPSKYSPRESPLPSPKRPPSVSFSNLL